MELERFRDKIIVVTGAASGIGAATARRFAREGARLALADIDTAAGEAIAKELGALFVQTDVTEESQVAALIDGAVADHGRIDVLVNNAGIMGAGTLPELDGDTWRRVIDIVREKTPRDIVFSVECGTPDQAARSLEHLNGLLGA